MIDGAGQILYIQIPTRIPEKIVVALFSGILVNSGIPVVVGMLHTVVSKSGQTIYSRDPRCHLSLQVQSTLGFATNLRQRGQGR